MATLLIFSDFIKYGDYEIETVAETSQRYRRSLISLGLDPANLTSRRLTQDRYELACQETAEVAAQEWPAHFARSAHEGIAASFDVPSGVKSGDNWIPPFIQSWSRPDKSEPEARLASRKATGAVEYMFNVSPALRSAATQTVLERPDWGPGETYQFDSFVRSILNNQLARQGGDTYVPAVSRAEQLARESDVIATQVEETLQDLTVRLKPDVPVIPRVSLALLRRARGDPAGIINEALEMRAKASWPREHLGRRLAQLGDDPTAPDPDFKTRAESGRAMRAILGLEKEPRLIDAVDLRFDVLGLVLLFSLPLPPVTLSGGKLADWVRHGMWKRRLVVLTDLARAPSFKTVDEAHLRTFIEKSTGRSFSDGSLEASTPAILR